MPDTKRGREQKGRVKREQRQKQLIERDLEMRDEELDFEALYEDQELDIGA